MSRKPNPQAEQLASIGRQIVLLEEEALQCDAQARRNDASGNYIYANNLREQAEHKRQRLIELTVQRDEIENV